MNYQEQLEFGEFPSENLFNHHDQEDPIHNVPLPHNDIIDTPCENINHNNIFTTLPISISSNHNRRIQSRKPHILFLSKWLRITKKIGSCSRKFANSMYHNKFITFMVAQLILIILNLLGIISQNLENTLSLITFLFLVGFGIFHCMQFIRRENEIIARIQYLHQNRAQQEHVQQQRNSRLQQSSIASSPSINLIEQQQQQQQQHLNDIQSIINERNERLRGQVRTLGQLVNQLSVQIRNNRLMMSVELPPPFDNVEPIIIPNNSNNNNNNNNGSIGNILLSSNLLTFLAELAGNNNRMYGQQNVGLTEEQINSFPIKIYKEVCNLHGNPDACTICLEDFNDNIEVRMLQCNHIFHKDCIDEWLKLRNNCPNCKRVFEFNEENNNNNN